MVTGIDRNPPSGDSGLDDFVQGDVRDPEALGDALAGVDAVVHLAAARGDWGIEDEEYFEENVEVTRELIEAGRSAGVKRWIFYSSVSAIGPRDEAVDEEANLAPRGPYGTSKVRAERLFAQLASEDPATEILVLRPSVVFGPANPPNTNIYRLVDAIYERRFLMVGNGSTPKSTSYIDNLLAAHLFLTKRMHRGLQTYIYVDDPVMTTAEIVRTIYEVLRRRPPRWSLPLAPARRIAGLFDWLADFLEVDLPITRARIEKFCRGTNYDATAIRQQGFSQPVANREAIRRTVAWHLEAVKGVPNSVAASDGHV